MRRGHVARTRPDRKECVTGCEERSKIGRDKGGTGSVNWGHRKGSSAGEMQLFALHMFNEKEVTEDQDQEPTRLHASFDAKAIASLGKLSFAGLAESEGPPFLSLLYRR